LIGGAANTLDIPCPQTPVNYHCSSTYTFRTYCW